jgi:hypothetical protein
MEDSVVSIFGRFMTAAGAEAQQAPSRMRTRSTWR